LQRKVKADFYGAANLTHYSSSVGHRGKSGESCFEIITRRYADIDKHER
jgi:hypothetical protein